MTLVVNLKITRDVNNDLTRAFSLHIYGINYYVSSVDGRFPLFGPSSFDGSLESVILSKYLFISDLRYTCIGASGGAKRSLRSARFNLINRPLDFIMRTIAPLIYIRDVYEEGCRLRA